MAVAASAEPAPSPEQIARSLLDVLSAFLAETRNADGPVINATLDSRLERDLGLDSLGRYELWLRVEQAFGVPGLGRAMVTAVIERDIIVVQNLVLLYATIFVIVNVLVDLSYAWLDPRIRY